MPLPKFNYCLICEDLRPEAAKKLTILGFFGASPDVNILIKELGAQVKVNFLVGTAGGEGSYNTTANLLHPDGSILVRGQPTQIEFEKESPNMLIGFLFFAPFTKEGAHIFQLIIDKKEVYRAHFNIQVGKPEDFG